MMHLSALLTGVPGVIQLAVLILALQDTGQIEQAISEEIARQRIPGLSAAVVVDNKLLWANGFGVDVGPRTVFRLASISKPITAIAAMQLVEKGKLDLDAPVQRYVPAFPAKPWPITTRQLLCHVSGIRHYKEPGEMRSTRPYGTLTEALGLFKDEPLLHEPGTKFSYTTYGYTLLGCVVEGASGMRFTEYLREHVFKPAGMERSGPEEVGTLRGFRKTREGEIRDAVPIDTSNKIPGGGLVSTAEDMARLVVALRSGILLRPETLDQMWVVPKTRDGRPIGEKNREGEFVGHGLGWFLLEDGRVRYGGAQPGTRALLLIQPKEQVALVLLCNLEGADLEGLSRRLFQIIANGGVPRRVDQRR